MLERGVIRKSVSRFCSSLWFVPKPPAGDGTPRHRVVVDFRELNKRTRTERYPLPRLEEMLDRMHGAKVFSIVDLKAGYHQIRMHSGDVEKTAFQFERGKYEYLCMPFGLKTAPTTFQRLMDDFLEALDPNAIQVYMDDIIVFSKSEAEHCKHLGQLLRRLSDLGLMASEEKSSFFQPELKFMGHTVSASGVSANREKVEAVRSLPRDLKEVKSFQGVNRIKEALTNASYLRYPDFTRIFVLTTDDSGVAVGAVLSQVEDGKDRPIAYASKKLTDAETRYHAIEREFWAWSGEFNSFDHTYGVTRWKETLAAYDTRGSENVVADCLPRMVNAIDSHSPTLDVHEEVIFELLGMPRAWQIPKTLLSGQSQDLIFLQPSNCNTFQICSGKDVDCNGRESGYERRCTNGNDDVFAERRDLLRVRGSDSAKPLEVVEADVMFWTGMKILTAIDRLTRFAYAYVLTDRTVDRVCEGLLAFFGTVGLPGALVMDKGREFNNAKVRTLLKEFKVDAHFTTPGHPRSHGLWRGFTAR
ncbi:hypothetical protein AAG570_012471 [Ranatra chinensis]|uniref:Reverse transcriptase domain-containing protein n=1 Tax=Ranatra chinensis TaxID=642074 RepID=A0ABD0YDY0_9HEMI